MVKLPTPNAFLTDPRPDGKRVIAIYKAWIQDELTHHPDAVVLMPLLNLDELYGPSYEGMNSVIQSMLHAAGRVNIDPARVYLIGHSESAPRRLEPGAALSDLFRRIQSAGRRRRRRLAAAATGEPPQRSAGRVAR